MGLIKEFKEFALKGNMVDMAIGIVVGGAFGVVVKSLVDNVIMPPVGYLMGRADFSSLSLPLRVPDGEPVEIKYGLFLNSLISLLIVAAALFVVVKMMNTARAKFEKGEVKLPSTKACPECCMDIPIKAKRCGHCTTTLA